jgi:predicted HicB family RNase H-like nuclease
MNISTLDKSTLSDAKAKSAAALAFASQKTEGETARLNANIKVELHKALKVRAATEGTSIGSLIEEWSSSWSKK